MKLRNKKTDGITDLSKNGFIKSDNDEHIIVYQEGTLKYYAYNSLAELNSEWEDYKPAEPLIKDEKIRKAVRAWWEAVSGAMSDKRILYKKSQDFAVGIYTIYCGAIYSEIMENKMYTITELCGEEEE